MGVGMVAVVAEDEAAAVVGHLNRVGERAWVLGRVQEGPGIVYEP
jgi:phosphoribosylaminoimidazole (AIR) synthetase